MKIKFASGIVPGNHGDGQKAECRDKIRFLNENGAAVTILAEGTENGTDAAAKTIAERFDELYASEDDVIEKAIREISGERPLLLVAVKDSRFLAAQRGDGLIVKSNGSCSVLSQPETEDDDRARLRVYRSDLEERYGFMLLSGGACRSLYEYGTGKLSPACGTFFQWLKEYDGETVSEALVDNINKYFVKGVESDIGVAVMVSGDSETDSGGEPAPVSEEEEPARDSRKRRNVLRYLLALIVVLAVIVIAVLQQPGATEPKDTEKEDSKPPVTYSENNEPTVSFAVDQPESYDAGEYKAGVDIPAGEYFFWTGEMLKPGSIVINDDSCLSGELYCMTIRLNDYDTLVTEYRFTAAENVDPVEPANGVFISGKYKIGKDIAPGTYTILPMDRGSKGRYYSILEEEISNDTVFDGEITVEVPDEGYIVFYNSVLIVDPQ